MVSLKSLHLENSSDSCSLCQPLRVVLLIASNVFNEDYQAIPERDELMNMLEQAVKYIMLGFLYKFVLAQIFGSMLLPSLKTQALAQGGIFNLPTLGVMYVFGFDLFFDFAGYSMFALAASTLWGLRAQSTLTNLSSHET